ncbi:MAG TPA: hypothetical protein VGL06_13920 [Pseudonocardiaceae bacterium]|jgi:hypothetical protein
MDTIGIAVVLLAVAVGLLYAMSFGLVVLFEHLQRTYRRRRALIPLTRRLHELLAEAGHPPVVRHSGGRHRRHPDGRRHRPAPEHQTHYDDTITGELPAYDPSYEPEYPTHDPDCPPYETEPQTPARDHWAYR